MRQCVGVRRADPVGIPAPTAMNSMTGVGVLQSAGSGTDRKSRVRIEKGEIMKPRTMALITAMATFAVLAMPIELAAQAPLRYSLVDLGTLGGSFSLGA